MALTAGVQAIRAIIVIAARTGEAAFGAVSVATMAATGFTASANTLVASFTGEAVIFIHDSAAIHAATPEPNSQIHKWTVGVVRPDSIGHEGEEIEYFLGRFPVPRPCHVAVMTAESGLATIQETARRICNAAGLRLKDCERLIWSPDLPRYGNCDHLDAVERFLAADGIEVLFLDPAYLAMPAADAANLMAQGELLRSMSELCQKMGVTLAIAHHTKRNTGRDPYEPLELQDIAWAGFAEFARQWWLVNRREQYEPGTGDHRLWLSVGGSAGHSALLAVDVEEVLFGSRRWDVTLTDAAGAREEAEQRKQRFKQEDLAQKLAGDRNTICQTLAGMPDDAGTKTSIKDNSGLNSARLNAALASLLQDKSLVPTTLTKGNNRSYDGYQLRNDT